MTPYDITGEFENRKGIGRFLRIFSCVVIDLYGKGAGQRLFMITSANARPGTVQYLAGVVRDQPGTVLITYFNYNSIGI